MINGLKGALKTPWLLVAYSIINGLTASDIEEMLTTNEASTRILTICSLVKAEGLMQYRQTI